MVNGIRPEQIGIASLKVKFEARCCEEKLNVLTSGNPFNGEELQQKLVRLLLCHLSSPVFVNMIEILSARSMTYNLQFILQGMQLSRANISPFLFITINGYR
jgi:hypothetical protein